MKNKKLIRFVESFVVLPMLTMSGAPVGPISQVAFNFVTSPSIVSAQKFNIKAQNTAILAQNQAVDPSVKMDLKVQELKQKQAKANAIDFYFKSHGMPLAGQGMKMVQEAEKNGLDWRLLPAIAVRESTGGIHDCTKFDNNAFGWGSCKIGFNSTEKAIEVIARSLGGNNPKTAMYYAGKNTKQILRTYNPPSIVPRYAEQVIAIMDNIGDEGGVMTSVAVS